MPLIQHVVGPLHLLCNRKLLYGRGVYLARVNHNLPPAWSTRIGFDLSLNLYARLDASGEKEIEDFSLNLGLADCTLHNARAVTNEEEDDSSTGPFVLQPSSDENLFAIQATSEDILDPDSFLHQTHQTSSQTCRNGLFKNPRS